MTPDPAALKGKVTMQEKIAELERRIIALESQSRKPTTATTTRRTVTSSTLDLEPEMSGIWQSIDALFKKAFK